MQSEAREQEPLGYLQPVDGDGKPAEFKKALGLFSSMMIVAGVMIGSGIFIVSAEIGRQVGSAGWLLVCWAITGVLTVTGALSYGELAAMMPEAGGMYVYLREAFSPVVGFLYGWTMVAVIQTGTIAAVAIAFARFSGVLFPRVSETNYIVPPMHVLPGYAVSLSTAQAVALGILLLAAVVNSYGVEWGRLITNVFTVSKLVGMAGLLLLGGWALVRHPGVMHANLGGFFHAGGAAWRPVDVVGLHGVGGLALTALTGAGMFAALMVSQTGSLFSADAWHNVTFVAGEVTNPKRNLPLALGLGTSLVVVFYILCNLAYLAVLPMHAIQTAPSDRVATQAVNAVLPGIGAVAMGLLIMVSTFGTVNAMTMAGARACFAMAQDGLFFQRAGTLNRRQVPGWGLALQCVWCMVLVLPRTFDLRTGVYGNLYSNLLDYVISAELLFYVLTVLGLFRLRWTRPEVERPYRCLGYPWLPAFYVVGAATVMVTLFVFRPATTWPGMGIVALGLPVYWLLRGAEQRRRRRGERDQLPVAREP